MTLGHRTKKTFCQTGGIAVASTTIYHYDQMGYLIAETTETGALIKDYIWNEMHPAAQIDAAIPAAILTYAVGSYAYDYYTFVKCVENCPTDPNCDGDTRENAQCKVECTLRAWGKPDGPGPKWPIGGKRR